MEELSSVPEEESSVPEEQSSVPEEQSSVPEEQSSEVLDSVTLVDIYNKVDNINNFVSFGVVFIFVFALIWLIFKVTKTLEIYF